MGSYDSKVLPERKPSITCQHTLSTYPAMRVERPQKARPVASRPPVEVLLHIPVRFSRLESCTLSRHAMLLPAVFPRLLVRISTVCDESVEALLCQLIDEGDLCATSAVCTAIP
jgi:hypothetical protein